MTAKYPKVGKAIVSALVVAGTGLFKNITSYAAEEEERRVRESIQEELRKENEAWFVKNQAIAGESQEG